MSGIAGIVALKPLSNGTIEDMLGAIIHRGRDRTEFYRNKKVHLATCGRVSDHRIASSNDAALVCGFSGVLSNTAKLVQHFPEIGQLVGHPSEIILHLYDKLGSNLVEVLEGQFALALYDRHKDVLILARDSVGISPLYYSVADNFIAFGSEMKAVVKSGIGVEPSIAAIYENFVYWNTSGCRTIFENIFQLPPGSFAEIDCKLNRDIRIQQYRKQHDVIPCASNEELLKEKVYATLADSINICDAEGKKWGVYLSGGLDSAIILRLANELGYKDVPVFSLGFQDSKMDESAYQLLAIDGHGGEHHRVVVKDSDIVSNLPKVLWHCETPLFKLGPVPMYLLSQAAQQSGVEFILSGEGADELFYGYDIFKETKFRSQWFDNDDAQQVARDIMHVVPPQHRNNPHMLEMYKHYYSRYIEPSEDALYCMRPRIDASSEIANYFTKQSQQMIDACHLDFLVQSQFSPPSSSALKQCQHTQMQLLLPGYLLAVQGDRVLMANSVQGRYPFLHPSLIELSMAIPDALKLKGYQEKYILKQAFAHMLPPEIVSRRKYQYSTPGAEIFFRFEDELGSYWAKETFERWGIFDFNACLPLLQSLASGSRSKSLTLTEEMIFTYIVSTHMLLDIAQAGFV